MCSGGLLSNLGGRFRTLEQSNKEVVVLRRPSVLRLTTTIRWAAAA